MVTLEDMQSRHRKEQRDLQSRVTNKKKNATKKNRKGINDECAQLERQLKERQEQELATLKGEVNTTATEGNDEPGIENKDGSTSTTNIVTEKLRETSISFDLPISSSTEPVSKEEQQQTTQGQGQGKKRNRQKERMARRAAEQEAAAAAAEEEASHMTDHRTRERTYLEREFRARGLVEREIRPDGHCLFSAVADQLEQQDVPLHPGRSTKTNTDDEAAGGKEEVEEVVVVEKKNDTPPPYRIVRGVATDYMWAHPDDFAPFLGDDEEEGGLESYIKKIRDTAAWGGQMELLALANAYGVEIKVIQDGRTETIEPSSSSGGGSEVKDEGEEEGGSRKEGRRRRTIWLAYYRHGYGLGEHYNSLRKANR
ncbi:hypothetical protein F5X99DRAFT_418991 [Biscogniauxia marginata]|nr:hypothetical protein F5X99DRAFT_418991 [Biscogniauxia marginata]